MEEYNIRFAVRADIPSIMKFIDKYWKKNHRLSYDRNLFEWQYINYGKVSMVIGENADGDIQAILGYIPYSKNDNKDFSLALWKAKEGTHFLGVKLLLYLLREEPHRNMFCNGINIKTSGGIYHRLGIKTGEMKQYYRLCDVENYRIAKIVKKNIPKIEIETNINLEKTYTIDSLIENSTDKMFDANNVPFKSSEYIAKKYFNHPTYEYKVYSIHDGNNKSDVAIVLRIQDCNGSRALRLIDVIGDYTKLGIITPHIDALAISFGAEYIDMYEIGLDEDMLCKAGWIRVGSDTNIIPNYFSPYEQCNVDISFCTSNESIVLFKGDGDQDRPN